MSRDAKDVSNRHTSAIAKRGNDLITSAECLLLVRSQIREYERMKRDRTVWRRVVRACKAVFA